MVSPDSADSGFPVVLRWTAAHVATGPLNGGFWYGLLCAALLLGPYLLASTLAVKEYARRIVRPTTRPTTRSPT